MNASDKLQLIRALEEREASVRSRSNWLAWSSVLVAAVVLAAMIAAGRRELANIQQNVADTQRKLQGVELELTSAQQNLSKTKALIDQASGNLQNVDGKTGGASAVEQALDNLLAASSAASSSPSLGPETASRAQLIQQLFDPSGAVRVKAYGGLLPRYKDDPTLVPEVLNVARQNPDNANGIYNALVVLSHMNAASLRPYAQEIAVFAQASQRVGPRVAERSRTLLSRLPQ